VKSNDAPERRSKAVRVFLSDPYPVILKGLRSFLETTEHIEVVGETTDLKELHNLEEFHLPDVVIVGDSALNDDWYQAVERLISSRWKFSTLLLSFNKTPQFTTRALRSGFRGIFFKEDQLDKLPSAIEQVHAGNIWFDEKHAHGVITSLLSPKNMGRSQPQKFESLTNRQKQIISLAKNGRSNKEIAEAVRVSQATVAHDLTRIYQIFDVQGRLHLMLKLRELSPTDHHLEDASSL